MKFNLGKPAGKKAIRNYMGGVAYELTPAMELYTTVATTLLDDSYYEKQNKRVDRIRDLIQKNDPVFAAKLAVYAREKMYLRSVPVLLLVEIAKLASGQSLISKAMKRVILRVDEITELLAYYQLANKREGAKKLNRLSKQIQKGLAEAFNRFDEYQFGKYNREGEVKLKDALFIVHPKAKDAAQQEIFDKIASDQLSTPYTWETELSALGQRGFADESEKVKAKALLWENLVGSGKLGYMALLRNLRNIISQGSGKSLEAAIEILTTRERVLKSKQFPFRFLSAYVEVEKLGSDMLFEKEDQKIKLVKAALTKAISFSIENMPLFNGRTLILSDNSGSMRGDAGGRSLASAMSRRTTADIANLFAVLCRMKSDDTLIGLFGDHLVLPKLNRSENVFDNFQTINEAAKSCGPNTEQGIFEMMERLIKEKIMVDRIIIFSDCQVGGDCKWYDHKGRVGNDFGKLFKKYQQINPSFMTYSVDLRGYGNTLFKEGVATISGWSERIFDLIEAIEKGSNAVAEIEKIEL